MRHCFLPLFQALAVFLSPPAQTPGDQSDSSSPGFSDPSTDPDPDMVGSLSQLNLTQSHTIQAESG